MILLATDCLLFQLANGESVPFSAETVSIELVGGTASTLDPEMVQNATAAVFHYFKKDLAREIVSVAEFAGALETVLRGFGLHLHTLDDPQSVAAKADNLSLLATGTVGELLFFPQLRRALRHQLSLSPRTVRFHGLRDCVKQLTGARRWSPRCDRLRDQIVDYLRECLSAEPETPACMLVVK